MSLQIQATNLSSVINPMCGLHDYSIKLGGLKSPTNSTKLDPITEQMVKTNDARLEIMNRFERGTLCHWWKKEKRLHSVSFAGEMMDWLCSWGKYHPQAESLDAESKSAIVSKQDETKDAQPKPAAGCNSTVFSEKIITSFEGRIKLNKSCTYSRPDEYYTFIQHVKFHPNQVSEDLHCKVRACVREKLMKCHPYCFPCLNATESQINEISDPLTLSFYYRSKVDGSLWYLFVKRTWFRVVDYHLNKWKVDQIIKLFNETIEHCEMWTHYPTGECPVNKNENLTAQNLLLFLLVVRILKVVVQGINRCTRRIQPQT